MPSIISVAYSKRSFLRWRISPSSSIKSCTFRYGCTSTVFSTASFSRIKSILGLSRNKYGILYTVVPIFAVQSTKMPACALVRGYTSRTSCISDFSAPRRNLSNWTTVGFSLISLVLIATSNFFARSTLSFIALIEVSPAN